MASPRLVVLKSDRDRGEGVVCDVCSTPRHVPPGQAMDDLVATLQLQGWLIKDGVDCCPDCRPGGG